jgi:hypothetical protein
MLFYTFVLRFWRHLHRRRKPCSFFSLLYPLESSFFSLSLSALMCFGFSVSLCMTFHFHHIHITLHAISDTLSILVLSLIVPLLSPSCMPPRDLPSPVISTTLIMLQRFPRIPIPSMLFTILCYLFHVFGAFDLFMCQRIMSC